MYGREALRRMREQQQGGSGEPERQPPLIKQVPLDAPYEDEAAVLHAWNGQRWVPYPKWLAAAPIFVDGSPAHSKFAIPSEADCVVGVCAGTRVWLVKDGERWLMFADSRKAGARRRDFASPFLGHAIRTAEQWYGATGDGWRAEETRNKVQP